jgi:hypothetical protein
MSMIFAKKVAGGRLSPSAFTWGAPQAALLFFRCRGAKNPNPTPPGGVNRIGAAGVPYPVLVPSQVQSYAAICSRVQGCECNYLFFLPPESRCMIGDLGPVVSESSSGDAVRPT